MLFRRKTQPSWPVLLFARSVATPLCYQQPFTEFCCIDPAATFAVQTNTVCQSFGQDKLWSAGYLEGHVDPGTDPHGIFQEAFLKQGLYNTLYYADTRMTWLGVNVRQPSQDLLVLQQLVFELRPKLIVETGTYVGGLAFFLATVLHLMGDMEDARVLTIDMDPKEAQALREGHGMSTLGRNPIWRKYTREVVSDVLSDTTRAVVADELARVPPGSPVLVSLDTDHHAGQVWDEIEAYAPIVSVGSYLVVQDVILNFAKHPWPGPLNAVQALLNASTSVQKRLGRWHWDRSLERFGYTGHAYLKRVA